VTKKTWGLFIRGPVGGKVSTKGSNEKMKGSTQKLLGAKDF